MPRFETGAPVRIFKQPSNQVVYMEGTTGFIVAVKEVDKKLGQLYSFHAVDDSGNSAGIGSIPEKCLIEDKSIILQRAMVKIQGLGPGA